MYKLDLPVDLKEAAAIERRRNQEEQRKARIFNSKTRIIGVDEQALKQQVKDRQQQELREKRRHEAFGEFEAGEGARFPCPTYSIITFYETKVILTLLTSAGYCSTLTFDENNYILEAATVRLLVLNCRDDC